MQRTEKYYEADAFRREATGRILAVEPGKTGGKLALDGTVFYPEGGGQPADRGTLTLADGTVLHVTDVHESEGVIWHTVDALPAGAVPGAEAVESIDWEWRFDKMQQHTGEHILSGILHAMFGAENVGFHIGSEAVRMDTSVPISAEGLREAELAANRIVWQDVPVLITYPTPEELAALTYRSKKEIAGQVRIVTIPGADVCACCGTHTATTGQVGQIKILASENYKGGVRLSVVCGQRALAEAQAMRARQADIGALLSAKSTETANAVHRVYEEYTALKFAHFGLCSQLFDTMARSRHVAHQLHLPVQSGCDRVLRAMNRPYDRAKYLELITYARKVMPDLVLTSDVIIGFPGETEAEAMETVELVRQVEFDALFTFIFSPRPGTPAAKMDDPVPRSEKQKWFDTLCAVQNDISARLHARYVGQTLRVLVDGRTDDARWPLSARTAGGRLVHLVGDEAALGQYRQVRITDSNTWALFGEMV